MLVMRTIEDTTNPVGELVSFRQSLGLDHFALAVYPLGFYGAKPRARCLGKRQLMILTPQPLFLTRRLCWPSHRLTSLDICRLVLSQMRSNTFLPAVWSFSQLHCRNCVVIEFTGLPSTNLSHIWSISGR